MRYFGEELRLAREAAGLTQEQLGKLTNFSKSHVAMVETGRRAPKPEFTVPVDRVLKTGGRFERMRKRLLAAEVYPDGFAPWPDYERQATTLWTYEALVVPGLLQSEEYARALLHGDEGKVTARMERQAILTRDEPPPPSLVTLINETVLRQPVGDNEVMQRQLKYLVTVARQFVIQVIPTRAQTYSHLDGPFVIATVDDRELVFTDTPFRAFLAVDSPELIARAKRQWDLVRSEALPVQQSINLIREASEQWT